jgi:hypothetical protein
MRPIPIQPIFCVFFLAMPNSFAAARFPITGRGRCNGLQPRQTIGWEITDHALVPGRVAALSSKLRDELAKERRRAGGL